MLFVVATPIGNLEDMSMRAARTLREADVIAAEDTRSVRTILTQADAGGAVNPARRVTSLFEGNEMSRVDQLLESIAGGAKVALVSEAGMPGISDPGSRVIAAAVQAGVRVEVIPGPVACIAALGASGLPTERFLFLGFPPRDVGARHQLLGSLRNEVATMVFYEAPDRVGTTCADLASAFGGERRGSVAREITKLYEEHVRDSLAGLAEKYREVSPRGECCIVVQGATVHADAVTEVDIESEIRRLAATGLGPKDIASRLVIATGKPRRHLYQLALAVGRENGAEAGDIDE